MITYGFSVQGKSHIKNNTVCQDFNKFGKLKSGVYIGIVADGVGSARHSDIGSKMAVESLYHYCDFNIKRNMSDEDIEDALEDGYSYAFDEILQYVHKNNGVIQDYDTTLSAVIYDRKNIFYGHAGDGGIIVRFKNGSTKMITKRQKGPDGISVRPLRSGRMSWEFGKIVEPSVGILLATDGMLDGVLQPSLINIPANRREMYENDGKKENVYKTATEFFMNPYMVYKNSGVKQPDRFMKHFIEADFNERDEKMIERRLADGYGSLFDKKADVRKICNSVMDRLFYLFMAMERVEDDKSVVCIMDDDKKIIPQKPEYYKEPDWEELAQRYKDILSGTRRPPVVENDRNSTQHQKKTKNIASTNTLQSGELKVERSKPEKEREQSKKNHGKILKAAVIVEMLAIVTLGILLIVAGLHKKGMENKENTAEKKAIEVQTAKPEPEIDIEKKADEFMWILLKTNLGRASEKQKERFLKLYKDCELDTIFELKKKEYGDLNKNVAKVKKKSANTSGAAVTDGKENISDVPVGLLCDIAEEISDNGKNDEFYEKIKDRYEKFGENKKNRLQSKLETLNEDY